MLRREPQECRELAASARRLAEEHLLVFWIAGLTVAEGWGLACGGRVEDGIAKLRSGIAAWKATGASLHLPTWYSYLADALFVAGDSDEAAATITEATDLAERNGDVVVLPELYRLRARALVLAGRPADAEDRLRQARATAARHGAKLFELRAVRDLASLWAEQGERHRALALLRPAYATVTEGHGTPDLMETLKLLQELERM